MDKKDVEVKIHSVMENEKMKLLAYAKLLNRKINSANRQAKNPFIDYDDSLNPFRRPIYNTLVWVESNEEEKNNFHN